MEEILILSGKGGTGKTTYTAAFSFFLNRNDIIVDCDVDAADMHIILEPEIEEEYDFFSGKECEVIEEKCSGCGICVDNCNYNAIEIINDKAKIDHIECEHCLLCYRICPENAIEVKDALQGKYFISKSRTENKLIHAKLNPGADNSGKLVSTIRTLAKKIAKELNAKTILIDGPPGVGCPVIASVSGVKKVVFITEPTKSGIHDLERVYELAKHFGVKSHVIINKSTINEEITKKIEDFCIKNNIHLLGKIPYDKKFYNALIQKKSIVEIDENYKKIFLKMWEGLYDLKVEG